MDTKSKNSENPSQTDSVNSNNVITSPSSAVNYNSTMPDTTNPSEPQKPWGTSETQPSQASQNTSDAQQAQAPFGTQASQNSSGTQQAQAPFDAQTSQNPSGAQRAQAPFDAQTTQNPSGAQQANPEKKRSFFARITNQPEGSGTPPARSKPSTWIAILLLICSGITIAFFPGAKDNWYWNNAGYVWNSLQDTLGLYYLAALALLALLAILLPFFKRLRQNSLLVKRFPAELAILAVPGGLLAQQLVMTLCYWYALGATVGTDALHIAFSFCIYVILYGVWLLAVLSLLQIPDMGVVPYFREKSVLIRNGSRIASAISRTVRQFIHDLTTINLSEGSDRWLLKVVLVNYLAMLVCFFFFGAFLLAATLHFYYNLHWYAFWSVWVVAALFIYSVLLFFILRRYVNRVKGQYQALLDAAGQLTQGNLQSETLTATNDQRDLGIFEPIREALSSVNAGFRKAVDLEMRSQAMKTELITNVSHDLKTPLTAIITYVNLLKDESITEEERREYVDILDRKSLRLKKLIEDLFEVSKAASGNIEIKKSQVDLAEMVRQAVAEQQDRLQAAGIDCRVSTPCKRLPVSGASADTVAHSDPAGCEASGRSIPGALTPDSNHNAQTVSGTSSGSVPSFASGSAFASDPFGSAISYDRVPLMLDSERTYRILENLLVNVSKYALPGTRAWVQLEIIENEAVITVKNTSAAELDFDVSTLTDRFVRGDKSRNTDGSGLGLAIVKNFTELQGGTFEIVTDGDLFKAIVRFPCGVSPRNSH